MNKVQKYLINEIVIPVVSTSISLLRAEMNRCMDAIKETKKDMEDFMEKNEIKTLNKSFINLQKAFMIFLNEIKSYQKAYDIARKKVEKVHGKDWRWK
jgi:predicted  nucleic acid-binding Zn-ribbon protein